MLKKSGLLLISLVVTAGIFLSSCDNEEVKQVRAMTINEIDLSKIDDGTYLGSFSYGKFDYEVETVIKNHRIENVKVVKNRKSKYAQKAEGVIDKVVQAQSLKVDVVTGATTTSKAILKAIENSLSVKVNTGQ